MPIVLFPRRSTYQTPDLMRFVFCLWFVRQVTSNCLNQSRHQLRSLRHPTRWKPAYDDNIVTSIYNLHVGDARNNIPFYADVKSTAFYGNQKQHSSSTLTRNNTMCYANQKEHSVVRWARNKTVFYAQPERTQRVTPTRNNIAIYANQKQHNVLR